MYRDKLPRIFEIKDALPNPDSPDAYFQDFKSLLADFAPALKHFVDLESELSKLDSALFVRAAKARLGDSKSAIRNLSSSQPSRAKVSPFRASACETTLGGGAKKKVIRYEGHCE